MRTGRTKGLALRQPWTLLLASAPLILAFSTPALADCSVGGEGYCCSASASCSYECTCSCSISCTGPTGSCSCSCKCPPTGGGSKATGGKTLLDDFFYTLDADGTLHSVVGQIGELTGITFELTADLGDRWVTFKSGNTEPLGKVLTDLLNTVNAEWSIAGPQARIVIRSR